MATSVHERCHHLDQMSSGTVCAAQQRGKACAMGCRIRTFQIPGSHARGGRNGSWTLPKEVRQPKLCFSVGLKQVSLIDSQPISSIL